MSHQRHSPKDALQLWNDPEWIARACDVYAHPAYCQARQTTKCFGRLMVEELDRVGGVARLTDTVSRLVGLPVRDFAARVPAVEVKSVPKTKVPTDHEAGADSLCPTEVVEVPQRPIVVAPLVRRALSIHLSEILDATADHLLPKEAIAYRPGRSEVVHSAILDVARAVRGGCTHWAKQDVSNFFPSVPWQGIETALRGFGYPDEFTQRVMALVMGPLEKTVSWRTWVPVETGAGTQAGLRESSIIANLFLSGLDRQLVSRFGNDLYYRRYSDDMLLMGRSKEVVRRAVVEVENWIEPRGLALKGIPPRNSPSSRPDARSLVHSNTNLRVEFLGAQINSLGHIHIPREKLKVLVAKVEHRQKYCTVDLDDAYYGYSKFSLLAPNGEQRGRYRFDLEDVGRIIGGFQKYWENLGAVNLGSSMDNHPWLVSMMGAGSDPAPHPWVAYLGGLRVPELARSGSRPGCVTHRGSGQTSVFLTMREIRYAWEADPIKIIEDDEHDQDTNDGPSTSSADEYRQIIGPWFDPESVDDGTGGGLIDNTKGQGAVDESYGTNVPQGREYEAGADLHAPDGDPIEGTASIARGHNEDTPQGRQHQDDARETQDPQGQSESSSRWGIKYAVHDPTEYDPPSRNDFFYRFPEPTDRLPAVDDLCHGSAPSPRPLTPEGWVPKKRDVYLATRYVHERRCHRIVSKVVDEDDDGIGVRVQFTLGSRLETELARLLRVLVEEAAQARIEVLVIRMESNKLSKSLLQRTSAVRSPRYFEEILRLHEVVTGRSVHVIVGGPSKMPISVLERVQDSRYFAQS